jgi:integrase/recombinase XerD
MPMLEEFVTTERARRRYLATPVGTYIDGYLDYLRTRGFAIGSTCNHAQRVAAFGEYLAEHDVLTSAIGDEHVGGFVRWYRAHPRRFGPRRRAAGHTQAFEYMCRGCARHFIAYLRHIGATRIVPTPSAPHPHLLAYLEFLEHHRGFARRTLELHGKSVGQFLAAVGPTALDALAVTDVEQAVVTLSKDCGVRCQQIMVSAIESFLDFERTTGRIPSTCRPFLPRRRQYALAHLPWALSTTDVERVLARADRTSASGRRDYAILQLLATYGLRASEIMALRLDDIDWRGAILRVTRPKVRRQLLLPLLEPVAAALVAYLRDGRPVSGDRRIFRRCHAPAGPLTNSAVYALVRKAIRAAGITAPHRGPHVFRHARATSLLRRGASLKTIGDLLGHRVPDATAIYCKLAVDDLRMVALEIPTPEVSR